MQYQWYPGHMSKAKRQIQDELSLMSQCLCLDVPHPPPTECARQEESGLDIIWSWTSGWVCPSLPQSLCQWYSALFGLPDSRRWVLGVSSSNMPCLATSGLSCSDSCLSWTHSCHVPEIFSWPSLLSCVRSAPRERGKIPPLT